MDVLLLVAEHGLKKAPTHWAGHRHCWQGQATAGHVPSILAEEVDVSYKNDRGPFQSQREGM